MGDPSLDRLLAAAPDSFHVRYRVERPLAVGHTATVLLGRHITLRSPVAIKILHQVQDQDAARFRREAALLTRLAHANVVPLLDHGSDGSFFYLVFRYYEAGSLADSMGRPRELHQWVQIFLDVFHGLTHVHEQGIVHRDVKPANIFLEDSGHAVLGDFGLGVGDRSTLVTRPGEALGTPAYMSPEALKGQSLDAFADLYAAGVVMYEAIAGRLPFPVGSPAELFVAKQAREPLLFDDSVPQRLRSLIQDLIDPDRDKRPRSARKVLEVLASLGAVEAPRAGMGADDPGKARRVVTEPRSTSSWPRIRRWIRKSPTWLTVVPMLCLVVLVVILAWSRSRGPGVAGVPPTASSSVSAPGASVSPEGYASLPPADLAAGLAFVREVEAFAVRRDEQRLLAARDLASLDEESIDQNRDESLIHGLGLLPRAEELTERLGGRGDLQTFDLDSLILITRLRSVHYVEVANLVGGRQLTTVNGTLTLRDPELARAFARKIPPEQGARELFLLRKFIEVLPIAAERLALEERAPPAVLDFCHRLFETSRASMTYYWRDSMRASAESAVDAAERELGPGDAGDPRGVRALFAQLWSVGRCEQRGDELVRRRAELERCVDAVEKCGWLDRELARRIRLVPGKRLDSSSP